MLIGETKKYVLPELIKQRLIGKTTFFVVTPMKKKINFELSFRVNFGRFIDSYESSTMTTSTEKQLKEHEEDKEHVKETTSGKQQPSSPTLSQIPPGYLHRRFASKKTNP